MLTPEILRVFTELFLTVENLAEVSVPLVNCVYPLTPHSGQG